MSNVFREDVFEIQSWLRALCMAGEEMPLIMPDGFYGETTAECIKIFQRDHAMQPTGVVDYETWCAVRDEYRAVSEMTSRGEPLYAFPSPDYVVFDGEKSDTVRLVQMMLSGISVVCDLFEDAPQSGVYDEATVGCVLAFQELCGLPRTGEVDIITWNRLAKTYNAFASNRGYTS